MRKSSYVLSLVAALFVAQPLCAQVIGGRVIDSVSGRPLAFIGVHVVDIYNSMRQADTKTDSAGVFYVELSGAGRFHITFNVVPSWIHGDTVAVGTDDFVQRRYVVAVPPEPVFFEFQVDKKVAPRPGTPGPHYPEDLRQGNLEGEVLLQFVVNKEGMVEPETIKVLRSSHVRFTQSAVEAILTMRFLPAEYQGHRVRQLVQQPVNFHLNHHP